MRHASTGIVLAALTLLTLSCGSDSPSTPAPPPGVTTEPSRSASQTVGYDGGTIQTTASDGTKYTLDIPEGALASPTKITMTPVTAIKGLPVLPDHVVAGLEFKPSGLVFAQPVRLAIESPRQPGAGTLPLAIGFEGDAASFELGAAIPGDPIVVLIRHFSGFGLGFGTEEDLNALVSGAGGTVETPPSVVFSDELMVATVSPPDSVDEVAVAEIMQRWFDDVILPGIETAGNDTELLGALGDFNLWHRGMNEALALPFLVDVLFPSEVDRALVALVPKLQDAIDGNNTLCTQAQNLIALSNVLFWQKQAELLGIDSPANNLDAAAIRANICAEVLFEGVQLPQNMQVGFPHSLDFDVVLKFKDGTTLRLPAAVSIQASNAGVQHPTGNTDANGHYTSVITANGNGPVSVTIIADLIQPGTTRASIIEGATIVNGSGGLDISGDYLGSLSLVSGAGGVSEIISAATITQNQNGLSGTFTSSRVSGSLTGTLTSSGLIVNGSVTANGVTLTASSAVATDNDGAVSISFTTSGTFPFNGGTASDLTLNLQGPNCKFGNLDEGGTLLGSSIIRVKHATGAQESFVITGTMTLTASTGSLTFSGGGFDGAFSGTTSGLTASCPFICVTGSTSLCGTTFNNSGASVGFNSGLLNMVIQPVAGLQCGTDTILEIRGVVQPTSSNPFCR